MLAVQGTVLVVRAMVRDAHHAPILRRHVSRHLLLTEGPLWGAFGTALTVPVQALTVVAQSPVIARRIRQRACMIRCLFVVHSAA